MAEKRLQAIAVADKYAADSGAVQSIFRHIMSAVEEESIDGVHRLTIAVDPQDTACSDVAVGKVLECNFTDGSFSEWRIVSLETTSKPKEGSVAKIVAVGPRYDLRHRSGIVERVEADGFATGSFSMSGLTVSEWVTEVLNSRNVPSYFVKGTITPTSKHRLAIQNMTPLDALEQLATLADCELSVAGGLDEILLEDGDLLLQEDGTSTIIMESSGYAIGMGTIGSDIGESTTSEVAFLHGMKNMQSIKRLSDAVAGSEPMATRVFPIGGPDDDRFTLADNRWQVTNKTTNTADLKNDIIGAPMNEDDQLNGLYAYNHRTGTTKEITDSAVSNSRLTIASHGYNDNDYITVVANSDGDDLTWLDSPSGQASYGKWVAIEPRPVFPNAANLLSDVATGAGFLDGTYASGLADGWNEIHGDETTTENTAREYYQHGTSSQKVVTAATGQGIISDAITVAPTTSKPNVLVSVWLMVTAKADADTFIKVQVKDHTNTVLFPLDSEDAATTNVLNGWTRIDIVCGPPFYDFVAESTTALKVLITSVGGTATFYVDAVSVENSARIEPTAAIIEGRSANLLWHEALNVLSNRKAPHEAYDVGVIDLRRTNLDSSKWPNDELILGATVTCVDEQLGIDTNQRISEIKRDLLTPGKTQIKLAADRKTLRGLIKPKPLPGTDPVGNIIPMDFGAKTAKRVVPVTRLTNIALSNPGRVTAFTWASGYPLKSGSDIQWKVTWDYTTGVDGDWDVDLVLFKDGVRVDAVADITATAKASSVETAGGHDSASAYYHVVGTLMDAGSNTVQTVQTSPSLRLT